MFVKGLHDEASWARDRYLPISQLISNRHQNVTGWNEKSL